MSRVTFPPMGNYSMVFEMLFRELGNEVIMPVPANKDIMTLGARYAPEFACLPLKITLGSYIDCLKRGADTIVTTGGVGPCRAGYYNVIQERILQDMGFEFDMIVFEPPRSHWKQILEHIRRLNVSRLSMFRLASLLRRIWLKINALDECERLLHLIRPREITRKSAERAYNCFVDQMKKAESLRDIVRARQDGLKMLKAIHVDDAVQPLKIGIVGEIYVLLEPFCNFQIDKVLGEMGVEVHRSIFLTGWTMDNAVVEGGGFDVKRAARPYLSEMVGGHGQDSVGHTIMYARQGFDGVIQLAPFTCIPEIVAKGVLSKVSDDFGIPVLSFFLDEQTGEAGVRTRLEAFVDMLSRKKRQALQKGA